MCQVRLPRHRVRRRGPGISVGGSNRVMLRMQTPVRCRDRVARSPAVAVAATGTPQKTRPLGRVQAGPAAPVPAVIRRGFESSNRARGAALPVVVFRARLSGFYPASVARVESSRPLPEMRRVNGPKRAAVPPLGLTRLARISGRWRNRGRSRCTGPRAARYDPNAPRIRWRCYRGSSALLIHRGCP